jgi:hypothetical protein
MWVLELLPSWIFSALLLAAVVAYLATKFLSSLPHAKLVEYASILLAATSIYMHGAVANNDIWLKRVSELELKVKTAEAVSAKTNTEIVEKVLIKTQVVKQKGHDIIKYVDREVLKIDESCKIPPEFVNAHNQAATK